MIHFESIEIEGFASIVKPLLFRLDLGPTLSIIRGDVGAGKTTIPSAMCWALYGKTLKEKATIEPWDSVKGENFRGTRVVVRFSRGNTKYTIIKCKGYKSKVTVGPNEKIKGGNNIFILENGELLKDKDIKGLTASHNHITKIIGYSFDLFKNSVIYGQKMKRIIEETGPNKKKVFDEAFEVGFIDEAKKKEELERDKLNQTYNDYKQELGSLQDKLDNDDELLNSAIENEGSFDKRKKQRVKELEENIVVTQTDIKLWEKELASISIKVDSKLSKDISKLKTTIGKIKKNNEEIEDYTREIEESIAQVEKHEKVMSKKPKLCPVCLEPLSDKGYTNMKASAKAAISILTADIKKHKKQLKGLGAIESTEELEKKLRALEKTKIILDNAKGKKEEITGRLETLKKRLGTFKKDLEKVEKETIEIRSPRYEKRIERTKKKIKRKKKAIKSLGKAIDIKDWLISDPLSNNGLKAYLFDDLLQKVNTKLDDYATILGFQVEFGINLDSHRKDFYQLIMKDNEVVPYEDLSGGQKQLVDTSVALAIHTVISELRPTNFLFMDEPFESLGAKEVEVVAELIQEKAKEASVFLITHHSLFNPVNVNEISVELDENGNTQIL